MIRYFTSHPTAANLLMIIFFVIGLFSLPRLRRESLPDFSPHEVEIQVSHLGATPLEIEESISQRIEDAIDGINYIKEVRSESFEGLSKVIVEMEENADFAIFLNDIKTEVDAIDDFPEDAKDPIVKQLNKVDQVLSLAITGPMSASHLKTYCEKIKDKLQLIDGISQINILGFSDHQIRIEISQSMLLRYGLSLKELALNISRQNIDLPTGSIETKNGDLLLRFQGQRHSPEEFKKIVVLGSQAGGEIYLGDIATITDLFEIEEEKITFGHLSYKDGNIVFDGIRAGMLEINKTKIQDALTVVEKVKNFIYREEKKAPRGINFSITKDISSIVKDRLTMLIKNGWQGMILVFLTMWLFFNLRFSFWVVMGLPVSFLGAMFFLPFIGYSINMITMIGMLLAIGLLMDDAIVISENIASHLQQGKSAEQAAIEGTSQVKAGVISSFLTTLCIFGPISFMEGNIGKVMCVMPVLLIIILSVSLVEAFLILPHHLSHALSHSNINEQNRIRKTLDKVIYFIKKNILAKIVRFAIRNNYLFVGCVFMTLMLSVAMLAGGILKFQAFPDLDGDVVEARILLPQGTTLKTTEKVVTKIVAALIDTEEYFSPEKEFLVKNINIQYNHNIDAKEQGSHVATVIVDLLNAEERNVSADSILNFWREKVGVIPDVVNIKFTEPAVGPAGLPIDIRLYGENLKEIKEASLSLQNWLNKFKGIQDLSDNLRPGKPEIQIRLREGAIALGIQAENIALQLQSAFQGNIIDQVMIQKEAYEIDVRLSKESRDNLSDLHSFYVISSGESIPLEMVAYITYDRGYSKLNRTNGQRNISIQGSIDTKIINSNEITNKIVFEFLPKFKKKYPNIELSFEGEKKESKITSASLQRGFIIGLLGIFILLSFQFKSYIEPIVVMLAIPMAFIGVIWGHLIMGKNLSMPSVIGFISLAGIVVNDSILLVEFIKLRQKEGKDILEAAVQASQERFRAVLLTSMTTVAGLIPLLLEKSLQAQILIPLAISLVFGIIASTVLVLIFVPCFYSIFDELGFTKKQ